MINPLELIRTKIQSEKMSYRQVGVALKTSIAEGGIRSLWTGLGPTLLRDLPFSGKIMSVSFSSRTIIYATLRIFNPHTLLWGPCGPQTD